MAVELGFPLALVVVASGVIARPQNKGTVSVAFAGPGLEYLYACSSDKIYRRKLKAKGVLFF